MQKPRLSRCRLIEFGRVQSVWFSARLVTDGNKIALTVIKTLEWAGLVNGLHYPAATSHLNKHIWCSNQRGFLVQSVDLLGCEYTHEENMFSSLKCKGWLEIFSCKPFSYMHIKEIDVFLLSWLRHFIMSLNNCFTVLLQICTLITHTKNCLTQVEFSALLLYTATVTLYDVMKIMNLFLFHL